MKLSRPQYEFASSEAPFPAFVGGFGSGKTHAAIVRTMSIKSQGPEDCAYYLPTYDLVSTFGIPRFCEFMEDNGILFDLNKSKAYIETPDYGGLIRFRTLDTPDRIVGYEVGDSIVDELDTLPTDKAEHSWNKIIARNRQKKRNGNRNSVGVVTTPEGFKFVYQRWRKNPVEGYVLYRARTMDNALYLPADYIQNLRNSYDENQLSAYLDGEFVNLKSGTVYHTFDRIANHAPVKIESGETLHVGMDFNVMNMTAIISVIRHDLPVTPAELTGVRDTPTMIELLKRTYAGHSIVVYPDASGGSRKSVNAQESDISLLKQAQLTVRNNPSNPAVKDRVQAVNTMMPRWKINTDDCPVLAESLEQQAYDKNGEPDKTSGHDHANEAAGYFIAHRWPIQKREMIVKKLRI